VARKGIVAKVIGLLYGLVKWLFLTVFKGLKWVAKLVWAAALSLAAWLGNRVFIASRKAAEAAAPKPVNLPLAEVKAFEGSVQAFEKWLYSSKSTVGIILGARGAGKSGLGMYLLENWAIRGRKTYAIGFQDAGLPAWVRCVNDVDEVPNNSVLLVDEGGILFNSREAMSDANKFLSKLLFVARHKDLCVVFISQNSANLEVNTIRQADYLLLKRPSLLQKDFERSKIKEIYDAVSKDFKELAPYKGLVYVYSDKFRGFASNFLPSFWSDRASKAFGKTTLKK